LVPHNDEQEIIEATDTEIDQKEKKSSHIVIPRLHFDLMCFLRAITSYCDEGALDRTLDEPSPYSKEALLLILKETGIGGILSVMAAVTVLPSVSIRDISGQVRKKTKPYIYPDNVLQVAIAGFEVFNNVGRLNLHLLQTLAKESASQLFHILSLLLSYCTDHYLKPQKKKSETIAPQNQHQLLQQLLHQLLLFIGYSTLLNDTNQETYRWGQSPTLLQRLCNLPFSFFTDFRDKNVLYPTLLSVCFLNPHNLQVCKAK